MTSLRIYLAASCGACAMSLATAQAPLSVDPTFVAPFTELDIYDVNFFPGEKLIVSGTMRYPGNFEYRCLYSLHSNGALDMSYLQPSPCIGGGHVRMWNDEFFYLRQGQGVFRNFMATGSTDHSYNLLSPHFSTSQLRDYHVFSDGSQWRTGWFIKRIFDDEGNQIGSIPGYGFLRVLPNGSPDPDFDHKYTAPGWCTSIAETPDGRYLVGTPGGPTQYEGRPVGSIIRIWPDASLDTTFQSTVYWGPVMRKKYFYPDGRFLMFGCFQTPEYPGDTIAILRLHPDGSTDTTWPHIPFRHYGFFPGLGQVRDFVEFEPGKLIVVGEFIKIGTREVGGIAVIDTAGNVLEDYFTGTGAGWLHGQTQNYTNRSILGVEQGPDGSIYIFGSYSGFDDGYGNHPAQRMITRLYPVNVGVGEISGSAPALRVWPNPGDGLLNVHWPGHTKAMLEVRDALGRMMHGGTYVGGSWQVDLSHLPSGLYTLLLSTPVGERATTKWTKQ